jgi:hypothetical protein
MRTLSSYITIMFEPQVVPDDISMQCNSAVLHFRRIGDPGSGVRLAYTYCQPDKSTKKGTAYPTDFKTIICAGDNHNQT